MKENCYKFCLNAYKNEYSRSMRALTKGYKGRKVSENKMISFDREAQKSAIRIAITKALREFPDEPVVDLWGAIYRAHLFRKSGISNLEVISKVISADQKLEKVERTCLRGNGEGAVIAGPVWYRCGSYSAARLKYPY